MPSAVFVPGALSASLLAISCRGDRAAEFAGSTVQRAAYLWAACHCLSPTAGSAINPAAAFRPSTLPSFLSFSAGVGAGTPLGSWTISLPKLARHVWFQGHTRQPPRCHNAVLITSTLLQHGVRHELRTRQCEWAGILVSVIRYWPVAPASCRHHHNNHMTRSRPLSGHIYAPAASRRTVRMTRRFKCSVSPDT